MKYCADSCCFFTESFLKTYHRVWRLANKPPDVWRSRHQIYGAAVFRCRSWQSMPSIHPLIVLPPSSSLILRRCWRTGLDTIQFQTGPDPPVTVINEPTGGGPHFLSSCAIPRGVVVSITLLLWAREGIELSLSMADICIIVLSITGHTTKRN